MEESLSLPLPLLLLLLHATTASRRWREAQPVGWSGRTLLALGAAATRVAASVARERSNRSINARSATAWQPTAFMLPARVARWLAPRYRTARPAAFGASTPLSGGAARGVGPKYSTPHRYGGGRPAGDAMREWFA
eukprot:scaffold80_cov382-Prasinococcus_capsulatus_cf.AAC.20